MMDDEAMMMMRDDDACVHKRMVAGLVYLYSSNSKDKIIKYNNKEEEKENIKQI